MRRCMATTVASHIDHRRSVCNSPMRHVGAGRRNATAVRDAPTPRNLQKVRRRCDDDDDNDDNEYLRPNKVAIFSKGRGESDHNHSNQIVKFNSSYRGGNKFRKSWHSNTDHDNNISRNNYVRRSFPESNYSNNGNGNFRNCTPLTESCNGWYLVSILNVEKSEEVIKKIQCYIAPAQFHPYNIHFVNNTLVFVIEDFKSGKLLHSLNRRITIMDRQKLVIKVKHFRQNVCNIPMPAEVKEKMALVIANRYDSTSKCLNLSHFHSCPLFFENQLFLPLSRPLVLLEALKIAAEYVKHELYGLSLQKNHLFLGEGLIWIRRLFPELKVLDLSNNKYNNLKVLNSLSGFTIEELYLSHNPFNNTDKECYKQKIQKMFPVLKKLDDKELESRYSYCAVVDMKLKMPINLDNSYPTPENILQHPNSVTSFVELFVTQYFERYDNKVSRQLINEAYHINSTFSLSCYTLNCSRGTLYKYLPYSRNLLISTVNKNKDKFVHKGRENITNFLEKLPKTKHDHGSFRIDVPLADSAMIQIVVNGTFAENYDENRYRNVYKSFCRSFCVVPDGKSWLILNDIIFITGVSDEIMIETVKRFNALKPSNKNYFNGNNTNNVMFMEDAGQMYSIESNGPSALPNYSPPAMLNYPPPSYQEAMFSGSVNLQQCEPILENQQMTSQQLVTSSTEITCTSNQQESNAMSLPMINMTQLPPPTASFCSSLLERDPSTKVPLSQSNTRTDKLTMIMKLSKETGMNHQWTEKCLAENEWNYSKALMSFTRLKSRIPPIAYIHYS